MKSGQGGYYMNEGYIAAGAAIVSSALTAFITYKVNKMAADREDQRRLERLARKRAAERIQKLYAPLLKALSSGPPDDFDFDDYKISFVRKKVEENDLCASPDLLNLAGELEYELMMHHGEVQELGRRIFDLVYEEHAQLKRTLGYGRILKKQSPLARVWERGIELYKDLRRKIRQTIRKPRIRR